MVQDSAPGVPPGTITVVTLGRSNPSNVVPYSVWLGSRDVVTLRLHGSRTRSTRCLGRLVAVVSMMVGTRPNKSYLTVTERWTPASREVVTTDGFASLLNCAS